MRQRGKILLKLCGVALVCSTGPGISAAPFMNLDFELAVIGTPVNYELPASYALPYWTANDWHSGYVGYDTASLGSTAVSVHDGRDPYLRGVFMYPIQGSYSVLLQSGLKAFGAEDAGISQVGDVPNSARSIMFSTDLMSGGALTVSFNGTSIPLALYSTGATINDRFGPVNTYIGDISAFSGHGDVTVRFEAAQQDIYSGCSMSIDAIQFSTLVLPEPSTLVLVALGSSSMVVWFRCRRRVP